jgi:stage II sporulation protein D
MQLSSKKGGFMKDKLILVAIFAMLMLITPAIFDGRATVMTDKNIKPAISVSYAPNNSAKPAQTSSIATSNEKISILFVKTGKVEQIDTLQYICGVVAGEMPVEFNSEALKAQAVDAYTYALRRINMEKQSPDPTHKGAYLCTDPTHCCAYAAVDELKTKWGSHFDVNWKKITDAVQAVFGKAMFYNDEPVAAVFHSISSGITENAKDIWGTDVSYLQEVESPGDKLAPGYLSKVAVKQDDFKTKILQKFKDAKLTATPDKWITELTRSKAGGVTSCKVGGVAVTGSQMREMFALRSTNFEVSFSNKTFNFTVKGYGHGVGLSQYGADYMARQGKKWDEILKWYYVGIEIKDSKLV